VSWYCKFSSVAHSCRSWISWRISLISGPCGAAHFGPGPHKPEIQAITPLSRRGRSPSPAPPPLSPSPPPTGAASTRRGRRYRPPNGGGLVVGAPGVGEVGGEARRPLRSSSLAPLRSCAPFKLPRIAPDLICNRPPCSRREAGPGGAAAQLRPVRAVSAPSGHVSPSPFPQVVFILYTVLVLYLPKYQWSNTLLSACPSQ
jgi:hypothetical protein